MSDEKKSGEPRPTPPPSAPLPAAGQTPGGPPPATVPRPPGPVIEYAMPAQTRRPLVIPKNLGCLVKMLFGFAVLLVLGYCALIALSPKARQWATSKQGPTPFKALNQILAIPALAIGKTKDVVAASDARVGVLDKVIADQEGKNGQGGPGVDHFAAAAAVLGAPGAPDKPATAAGAKPDDQTPGVSAAAMLAMSEKLPTPLNDSAAPPGTPAGSVPPPQEFVPPTQVKLPGGIIISSASPAGTPAASQPFLYWVVSLNISGVFQSNPPRLMMNGRLIYEGQEVNAGLGIVFDHLDLAKKLILFRDQSGAIVTRNY